MKKVIKYSLFSMILCSLSACTAWEDAWNEIIPLPESDNQVIVEPWDKDENDTGLGK